MKQKDYLNGHTSSFVRRPVLPVTESDQDIALGWRAIFSRIAAAGRTTIAVECYQGVDIDAVIAQSRERINASIRIVDTRTIMRDEDEIENLIQPDVTDDPIFGYMTRLTLRDFFPETLPIVSGTTDSPALIVGPGATLLAQQDAYIVYADMPRWEIQARQRADQSDNLGRSNRRASPKAQYKQSYFVDWRVLDRHKKQVLPQADVYLESVDPNAPKLVPIGLIERGLDCAASGPFELLPFFDPGVWGGHWMKQVCGVDTDAPNLAWCFNCVPEENSLLLGFGTVTVEIPAINIVFFRTRRLLGDPVHARFGDEFPIRFDFLDTMGGQNLSFQVHPLTEYIREHFGMHYTQDESYYILDAEPGAVVYLGLKSGVDRDAMRADLETAQSGGKPFPAEDHVQTWPVAKHDHYLIPAGTPHCSGSDSVVLEISATPYIFTFKLWDWGRLDLDGTPRPINVARGWPNIQWDRTTEWTGENLVNRVRVVAEGNGWREEQTGLHDREFIETRRHWFSVPIEHDTGGIERGSVHVLNLVEGREATVESPSGAFEPFCVHYAETFVIPAAVGRYTVRPSGDSKGDTIATVRASVRTGVS